MVDKAELCDKIISIYPDIGVCGVNIDVDYDTEQASWVVHLNNDKRQIKHFLPDIDAEACMNGKQCISLAVEIGQFRSTPQPGAVH